jgi:hypothetical protein
MPREERVPRRSLAVPREREVVGEDLGVLLGPPPRSLLHPLPDDGVRPRPSNLRDRRVRDVAREDVVEGELTLPGDRGPVALRHEALRDQ